MTYYYSLICGVAVVALVILISIIGRSDVAGPHLKLGFTLAIVTVILVIAAEFITLLFGDAELNQRIPNLIGNMVGFSVSPFIPLFIGFAIRERPKRWTQLFWIPATVNVVLVLLSPVVPLTFSLSETNVYIRSDFFFVFLVAYISSIAYLFLETLFAAAQYQNSNRFVLIILFAFVVLGSLVQVVYPVLYVTWLCAAFSVTLYYVYYCELYHQIDGLSELLNRRAYENCLKQISGKKNVTIVMFDIDDFKRVNDQHGHIFGDQCILTISKAIRNRFSKLGLCFRTGGDEFCVIGKAGSLPSVEDACRRFSTEIKSARRDMAWLPSVSVGYVEYRVAEQSLEDALLQADHCMYDCKERSKAISSYVPDQGKSSDSLQSKMKSDG